MYAVFVLCSPKSGDYLLCWKERKRGEGHGLVDWCFWLHFFLYKNIKKKLVCMIRSIDTSVWLNRARLDVGSCFLDCPPPSGVETIKTALGFTWPIHFCGSCFWRRHAWRYMLHYSCSYFDTHARFYTGRGSKVFVALSSGCSGRLEATQGVVTNCDITHSPAACF